MTWQNGLKRSLKQALRSVNKDPHKTTQSKKLSNFLLAYITSPYSTTGETPATLLMGRNFRTKLDLVKPDLRLKVENNKLNQAKEEKPRRTHAS